MQSNVPGNLCWSDSSIDGLGGKLKSFPVWVDSIGAGADDVGGIEGWDIGEATDDVFKLFHRSEQLVFQKPIFSFSRS